jgi:hypothetical protein
MTLTELAALDTKTVYAVILVVPNTIVYALVAHVVPDTVTVNVVLAGLVPPLSSQSG